MIIRTLSIPSILIALTACSSAPTSELKAALDLTAEQHWIDHYWQVSRAAVPEYPRQAAQRELNGCVRFHLTIDSHGRPQQIELIESFPAGVFDQSARRALAKFQWQPGKRNTEAQSARIPFQLDFTLQGGGSNYDEAWAFCFIADNENATVNEVEAIALNWLQLIDQGQYETSWQQAGSMVQQQLSASQWQNTLHNTRKSFGALQSRTVLSQQEHRSLPGVPDGRYLVLIMQSQFEHKAAAVETLTLSFEQGEWRAIGYFIR
ncbi:TonB family protein [Alkalimonas amylolytica]|uniref:Protein TonB n=1 Tax=Alkalimonas amylolytica TaxID=152573 RepID=A0A1H4FUI0_ALKAM|nr:TonB family protein [Alkalimonas amylolytica]SEB00986.1 TonB family C-terminal domain-containing protein [Alkalimonas amylolytica]